MNKLNKIAFLAILSTLMANATEGENQVDPAADMFSGDSTKEEADRQAAGQQAREAEDSARAEQQAREEAERNRQAEKANRLETIKNSFKAHAYEVGKNAKEQRLEDAEKHAAAASLFDLNPEALKTSEDTINDRVRADNDRFAQEEADLQYQAEADRQKEIENAKKLNSALNQSKGDSPKAKALRALKDVKMDANERDKLVYAVEHEKDALDATSDFKKGSNSYKAKPLDHASKLKAVLQRPLLSSMADDKAYFELDKDNYVDPYVLGRVDAAIKAFPKASFAEVVNAKKIIEDFNKKIEDIKIDKASYDDKTKQSFGSKFFGIFKKNAEKGKELSKNDVDDFWKESDATPRRKG